MPIYLDANIFYNAYCPIEDRFIADWILKQLSSDFPGITSEWTVAEMFRGIKKQVNLNRIEKGDAQVAIDLFLSEIGENAQRKVLKLIPIKISYIMSARPLIFNNNLYAADAIHAVTAIQENADAFITFDSDFKRFGNIPVLNPKHNKFQNSIINLKNKYIKKTD
jgi:predicted nucleic acid-binding protein